MNTRAYSGVGNLYANYSFSYLHRSPSDLPNFQFLSHLPSFSPPQLIIPHTVYVYVSTRACVSYRSTLMYVPAAHKVLIRKVLASQNHIPQRIQFACICLRLTNINSLKAQTTTRLRGFYFNDSYITGYSTLIKGLFHPVLQACIMFINT